MNTQVTIERKNEDYLFHGTGKTGIAIPVDNKAEGTPEGASPMELLLIAVGTCSAIDIVSILKKQRQHIDSYKMVVNGERHEVEGAKPFKSIEVIVQLEGEIDPKKALRAAELSFTKYCSVSMTLEPQVPVSYLIEVNGVNISE